jgi:hypothetical protein
VVQSLAVNLRRVINLLVFHWFTTESTESFSFVFSVNSARPGAAGRAGVLSVVKTLGNLLVTALAFRGTR